MNGSSDVVFQQAAAIPWRATDRGPQILLITSRGGKRWIVPKGIVESWQSPKEAALEEAFEEAGVRGVIVGETIGEYEYGKWGGICRVEVYVMRVEEVLSAWPEADFRERRWAGVEEALETVDNPDLRRLIKGATASMT